MSFKDLAISFDLIPVKLAEFADGPVRSTIKGLATHFEFQKDGKRVLLIAHKRNKGTVTLQPAGGHPDLAAQAAQFVADNAHAVSKKHFNLTIHGYSQDRLNILCEYLVEECQASLEGTPTRKDKYISTKVKGRQGDVLTLNLYDTGTLLVQGRPIVLAVDLLQFLSEEDSISQEELFSHLGTIFETKTTPKEANDQLTAEFPYASTYAGTNLRKILSTAISMRGLPIHVDDYSVISSPALRALESFMRKAVLEAIGERWNDFGGVFSKVQQTPPRYRLLPDARKRIGCQTTCALLEECYSHYCPQRHGTFHAEGMDGEIRIISDRAEALEISEVALGLINNYSKALLEKK